MDEGVGGLLDGVRVLDLTRVLAGPMSARLLADMGADVIKVEPPDGDFTRGFKPQPDGVSPYFAQANAGKRNVSVDLTADGGADLVATLAAECDVVIENFRPGVLAKYGLDAETLRGRDPSLVYCSISGYGQTGPWVDRRAYAPLVHAEAGLLDFAGKKRGTGPMPEVQAYGDTTPALMASNAICAALFRRERTGVGQHLDLAMAEVVFYMNEWVGVDMTGFDEEQLPGSWTSLVAELSDGRQVAFAANIAYTFKPFAKAMGRPELLDDPRFATLDARKAHRAEIIDICRQFVATFDDARTLEHHLEPFNLPLGVVRSLSEFAATEWATERGLTVTTEHGFAITRAPFAASDAEVGTNAMVAARGQHNRTVLSELLHLDDGELTRLENTGVLLRAEEI